MSDTFLTSSAWLAVLAIAVSAVLFGLEARQPTRQARDARADRNRRIGAVLSISGPFTVVLLALGIAAMTGAWLTVAVIAFAAVGVVALAGLVLAPH